MDRGRFYELLQDNPVILAAKDPSQLAAALAAEGDVVFLLFGDVCTIGSLIRQAKAAGKTVLVHIDRISGLSARPAAVDFIRSQTCADGIISTQPQLVKRAAELGLLTVLRFFALDSMSLSNLQKQLSICDPSLIEIMPGLMPKIIRSFCQLVRQPVIAGGLVSDKEDVFAALKAGAISVSTTCQTLWGE